MRAGTALCARADRGKSVLAPSAALAAIKPRLVREDVKMAPIGSSVGRARERAAVAADFSDGRCGLWGPERRVGDALYAR